MDGNISQEDGPVDKQSAYGASDQSGNSVPPTTDASLQQDYSVPQSVNATMNPQVFWTTSLACEQHADDATQTNGEATSLLSKDQETSKLSLDDEKDGIDTQSHCNQRSHSPMEMPPKNTRDAMSDGDEVKEDLSADVAESFTENTTQAACQVGTGIPRKLDLGNSMLKPKSSSNGGSELNLTQQRLLAMQRKVISQCRSNAQLKDALNFGDAAEITQAAQPHDPDSSNPSPQLVRQSNENSRDESQYGRIKDDEALAFEKIKKEYEEKKRSNAISMQEEITFMQLQSTESTRQRKLQADEIFDLAQSDDESESVLHDYGSTFVPSFSSMISDDEGPGLPKKRRREAAKSNETTDEQKKPRKRSKPNQKVPGTDYTNEDFEAILEQGIAASTKPKKATTRKAKSTSKKTAKPEPEMTNLGSIMGTNVFEDVAATAELHKQPQFESSHTRRDNAFKDLIASVPIEDQKVAKSDKKYLDDAIKDFNGKGSVSPSEDGNWLVKGMKSSLKHYQVLGVAFMRRRENVSTAQKPSGGILADEMGLGKTVMMLANIVNGKTGPNAERKATLIVATPALVAQWYSEIGVHCLTKSENKHGIGRVLQYHAGARVQSNDTAEMLRTADIVLTTYTEVGKSYPKAVVPPQLTTGTQKDAWWREHYEKNKGILHRVNFYRVVLDEAHAIKNHRSQTSMACRAITATHYWAITGTPVMNNIKEFYSYFKFLREPNTGSYRTFKTNFCSPDDPERVDKLNVFLRKYMIRRTHLTRLFNARLLDLPKPEEKMTWLEFNEVERQIYEIVKQRFIQRINMISKQDGLEKSYGNIWTMILRLRQICCHILLVQETFAEILEREDFERLNNIITSENETSEEGVAILTHLRHVLTSNVCAQSTAKTGPGGSTTVENAASHNGFLDIEGTEDNVGGQHGRSFSFGKYIGELCDSHHWENMVERSRCRGCHQQPLDPYVTSCHHIYCKQCLEDLGHVAACSGRDHARCAECGEAFSFTRPCKDPESFWERENARSGSNGSPSASTKRKKGKSGDMEDWLNLPGEVVPSAKTRAAKAQVLNWLQEDPAAKIVIYSQFLPCIKILAKICRTEGWGFCKYTGDMSHDSRAKVIEEFGSNPDKLILLASLKCGGLGLNLTMASRVLQLDPWWNAAVEQQAFCRVFRIGQQKETKMTRLVVRNTIDAAMMAMQERKQLEIDDVMDDAKKRQRPTIEDLMRLFGKVGQDSDGVPFIFPQEEEPECHRLANTDGEDEQQWLGNEE